MLTPTVGYIKINRFAETTYDEFQAGMTRLRNAGMKTFVIDLRDNSGGYMEMAVKIADELLVDQKLIVFTKDKKGKIEKANATEVGDFEQGKVCILINENSASASEILAGAIQDNDRGVIIGRRSFGKGLVQKETSFDDGSAVRLTVARYYTPTGRSIQKPYKKGDEADYENEFNHRFENGELYEKDSIKVADSLKFKTKKGKIVYGGGGIVPDVFVPLEGKKGEESISYIMQESGLVSNFVFEQLDVQRDKFLKMGYQNFVAYMSKSDEYLDRLQNHLNEMRLHVRLSQNKSLVQKYLTAEFAAQLFGEQKYFEIALKNDPMIEAALRQ
jgi:carboxyl-terminal processing protease